MIVGFKGCVASFQCTYRSEFTKDLLNFPEEEGEEEEKGVEE